MQKSKVDLNAVVRRANANAAGALEELFTALQPILRSTAQRYSRSVTRFGEDPCAFVEDVVSESCLKLMRALTTFRDDGGSFEGFARTVTTNIALDRLRVLNRRGLPVAHVRSGDEADGELINPVDLLADSVDSIVGLELQRAMDRFVAEDREAQRNLAALLANLSEGVSQSEIAERFGVKRETVNRWIADAKSGLRRCLAA